MIGIEFLDRFASDPPDVPALSNVLMLLQSLVNSSALHVRGYELQTHANTCRYKGSHMPVHHTYRYTHTYACSPHMHTCTFTCMHRTHTHTLYLVRLSGFLNSPGRFYPPSQGTLSNLLPSFEFRLVWSRAVQ